MDPQGLERDLSAGTLRPVYLFHGRETLLRERYLNKIAASVPEGFEAQHDQIWQNTLAILADAGMGPEDIVRLNVYSTDPDGLRFLKVHREKYLKPGHTPASTWVVCLTTWKICLV